MTTSNQFSESQINRAGDGKFATMSRGECDADVSLEMPEVPNPYRDPRNDDPSVLAAIAQAKATGQPVALDPEHYGGGLDEDEAGNGTGWGGDVSLGAEPSNRITWATGNDDEPFISATEIYFVTARRDGDNDDLDYNDWEDAVADRAKWDSWVEAGGGDSIDNPLPKPFEDEPGEIIYSVENTTEWIAHTDVGDPGSTERRSDMVRGEGSVLNIYSLEDAEAQARRNARSMETEHYSPENWK